MTEREEVAQICKDLVWQVHFDPLCVEAHCETGHHDIKCWKVDGLVRLEIKEKHDSLVRPS